MPWALLMTNKMACSSALIQDTHVCTVWAPDPQLQHMYQAPIYDKINFRIRIAHLFFSFLSLCFGNLVKPVFSSCRENEMQSSRRWNNLSGDIYYGNTWYEGEERRAHLLEQVWSATSDVYLSTEHFQYSPFYVYKPLHTVNKGTQWGSALPQTNNDVITYTNSIMYIRQVKH